MQGFKETPKLILCGALATAFAVCGLAPTPAVSEERPKMLAPLGDPPNPADNPTTEAKVELGKMLFFDPRLSGNAAMACSACHLPDQGWGLNSQISFGYPGTTHWRNSPTVVNSAYYGKLFWAGASKSLEGQARSAARGGVAGNAKTMSWKHAWLSFQSTASASVKCSATTIPRSATPIARSPHSNARWSRRIHRSTFTCGVMTGLSMSSKSVA